MGVRGQCHPPAYLPPGKRHYTYCMGGWEGARAGLNGCRKSCLPMDSILGPSKLYQVAVLIMLSPPTVNYNG